MPKLINRPPQCRKHKASGQAVVTLKGTDHYLGPHGTKGSHREYDRVVAVWMARGRINPKDGPDATLTVVGLLAA